MTYARQNSQQQKKAILLCGMSGVGKTHLCRQVNENVTDSNKCYHYSVDYQIAINHLLPEITSEVKKRISKDKWLAKLIKQGLISVKPKVSVDNISLIGEYLTVFDQDNELKEFKRRQEFYRKAERASMLAVKDIVTEEIPNYRQMLIDSTGSLCEVISFDADNVPDMDDDINRLISKHMIVINFETSQKEDEIIIERALGSPKPMLYNASAFDAWFEEWSNSSHYKKESINNFIAWVFPKLIARRRSLNRALANKFGVTVQASDFWSKVNKLGSPMPVLEKIIRDTNQ